MSDQQLPEPRSAADASPFDKLLASGGAPAPTQAGSGFTTAFRGYDKDEVDVAIAKLTARLRSQARELDSLEERYHHVAESANASSRDTVERFEAQLAAAQKHSAALEQRLAEEVAAAAAQSREEVERLEAELAAANARIANSEQQVQTLTEELVGSTSGETANRHQFEEVLRVAEEQASVLIRNATVQADRLLEAANEEIRNRRKDALAEADMLRAQAEHDAQQARLRIDTELTAHEARLEREAAHAAEKISQAEQEAAAIRSEAEKGIAALRSMVARETTQQRAEAEEAVRELRMRALEFEESLSRRQDDAQQEFLLLHNQAVAHAERITQDANEQVAASLEHAQRVATKADDFDRLMRAQAAQIEADANVRARERLDQARLKAQKIIDTVTAHSQSVLRDAEDRTRQLRWQQHQLTSFMAEVRELIRPEGPVAEIFEDEAMDAAPAAIEIVEQPQVDVARPEIAEPEIAEPEAAEPEAAEFAAVEFAAAEPDVVEAVDPEPEVAVESGDDEAESEEDEQDAA